MTWGPVLDGLWRRLRVDTVLRPLVGSARREVDVEWVLFALVANRVVRDPRSVLPSTAITRRPVEGQAVARPASQAPIAAVSSCGSMACSNRRIIASDGRRSAAMPRATTIVSGASAIHSAIAAYER
jgi:hypothetical protein